MSKRHTYDFADWDLYEEGETSFSYRPSLTTLFRRLVWTFLACVAVAALHYFYGQFERQVIRTSASRGETGTMHSSEAESDRSVRPQSLKEPMMDDAWQADLHMVEKERAAGEARAAELRARREFVHRQLGLLLSILTGLLLVAGVLPPASALWEQLTLARSDREEFLVTHRRWLTRTERCSLASLKPMRIVTSEIYRQEGRARARRRVGSRWTVLTESDAALGGNGTLFEFHTDLRPEPAVAGQPLPPRVAKFLGGMQRLTGLTCGEPVILDPHYANASVTGAAPLTVLRQGPTIQVQFHKLEDVPPELRADVQSMLAKARESGSSTISKRVTTNCRFTFRDSEGREATYTSPEEMPPHVREIYERLRREQGLP